MKEFSASIEANRIVKFIRDYYRNNKLKGAVIGISGGKDSGVVAALLVKALGKENVLGVTMPCHSDEKDRADAKLISDYYGFELINIDLTDTYDTFKKQIKNYTNEETDNSDINLKPRLRMSTLYYLAALYTNLKNAPYLVIGTSNKCELFVGYFTKGGDNVNDISPIADLTVEEVIMVGEYLKVPKQVLYKTPNDGLSNLTDEDKLGVKYSDIAIYMENPSLLSDNIRVKIKKLHDNSLHKFSIPTYKKED